MKGISLRPVRGFTIAIALMAAAISLPSTLYAQPRTAICGQERNETVPTCPNCDFEEIAFPVVSPVRAWRNRNGNEVVLIQNKVAFVRAHWVKDYSNVLFWKRLKGSKIVVVFDPNQETQELKQAAEEIIRRFPNSMIRKPWMLDTRIVPVSTFLVDQSTILPCRGHLTGELPMSFGLSRYRTNQIGGLDNAAFILSGTLSYYEGLTGRYITQSFDIRKSDLQILK